MVIPRRRCSDTWSIFAPFRTRSSGKGDNWCFCLVAIIIDLVLIGLMTIWLLSHQLDTWSKQSCILLLICIISFPDVCSVVSSASMSQSTDISFTCNGRSLIKRLKRIGPKMNLVVHHTLLILWRSKSHGVRRIAFCYEDMILKNEMVENLSFKDKWRASSIEYRDQPGRKPSLGLGILLQIPQIYSWLLAKNLWDVPMQCCRSIYV